MGDDRRGGATPHSAPSAEEADLHLQTSARQLDAFLDDQLTARGLQAGAMALLGFSQGAGMAYEVGPRRHDPLARVIAMRVLMAGTGHGISEDGINAIGEFLRGILPSVTRKPQSRQSKSP